MADESEASAAGLQEPYADSDSGDDFGSFDRRLVDRRLVFTIYMLQA